MAGSGVSIATNKYGYSETVVCMMWDKANK